MFLPAHSRCDERRIYAYKESISGVRPHLERRISIVARLGILLMYAYILRSSQQECAGRNRQVVYILRSKCGRTPEMLSSYAYILRSSCCEERRIYAYKESISGVRPHLERRIHTYILSVSAGTFLPHFWCSSSFRTKNIHIYLVCFCRHILAAINEEYTHTKKAFLVFVHI